MAETSNFDSAPSLMEFFSNVLNSKENCIKWMQEKGLLANTMTCDCGENMSLVKRKDISDGCTWSCNNCLKKKSIRENSYFYKSRLSLQNILQLVYFFGADFQIYQCEKLISNVDEKTIIKWFGLLRDVCSNVLLRNPVKLGSGLNTDIIEIDESLFGKKRKYHRGTGRQQYWVFGMVERNSRKCVMQMVEKRDRVTLLPIIKKYVDQGSTIFSDEWKAYFTLNEEGYCHDTVNHSKEFVSDSGCCTNSIEGLWGMVKLRIKKMKGILPAKLPEYLDEFMYRYRFGFSNGDVFNRLVYDIANFKVVDSI